MSWRRESISMPSVNAGILGIGAGEKMDGIQMSPKTIVIGIVAIVVVIKILDMLIAFG